MLDMNSSQPIYIQIAEWLEKEIIDGALVADQKVYSQYQLAELFNINPATAGKGLTLLVEDEIIYQRRGLGTFVSQDARSKLLTKRKNETLKVLIRNLLKEANLLNLTNESLYAMIETEGKKQKEEEK